MATLLAKKPTYTQDKLKCMLYGDSGAGKTTAATSFPNCYVIDTEGGTRRKQYVDRLIKNNSVVFPTTDFDEVLEQIKALSTQKHEYKTLAIDHVSNLYESLVRKYEKQGTSFGSHYDKANKDFKKLVNHLKMLDMNVILVAQSKNEYEDRKTEQGKVEKISIGKTYDSYKKLDFEMDLVLEIKGKQGKRTAIVHKSRISEMPQSSSFTFSYDYMIEKYGKEIMERECLPKVIASAEQIKEIYRMIDLLKIEEEWISKTLDKAKIDSFEEIEADKASAIINYFKLKIEGDNEKLAA